MGITIIICIIAGAGLLGGSANYFMEQPASEGRGPYLLKSVLLGLTAAATVPLFLQTVSSELMTKCIAGDVISYFVLFGFCTVAAIFSSKFLQSLADKLLQEVKEVKEKQEDLSATTETLVLQNSDPAPKSLLVTPSAISDGSEFEAAHKGAGAPPTILTPVLTEEQKVLNTLQSGKYPFRTVAGLSKDANLSEGAVQEKLAELETRGLVKKTKRAADGATVWSLR